MRDGSPAAEKSLYRFGEGVYAYACSRYAHPSKEPTAHKVKKLHLASPPRR